MHLLLAGGSGILERGINVSQNAAASWNERWDTIFDSQIFAITTSFAAVIAVTVIGFLAIELFKELNDQGIGLGRVAQKLLAPVIVVLLMANNGAVMALASQGGRNVMHDMNRQALQLQLEELALEDAIKALVARGVTMNEVSAQINQCRGMVGTRQYECLRAANDQIQASLEEYESRWLIPLPAGIKRLASSLAFSLSEGVKAGSLGVAEDVLTVDDDEGPLEVAFDSTVLPMWGVLKGGLQGLTSSAVNTGAMALLMPLQWAFVNTLEIAMLLSALTMPIAVALTLLPFPTKPLISWVIAFFSLGLCQFYYNIIMGVIAVTITNSDAIDINGFLIILATFGPALAIGMAAGGGISLFNIIFGGSLALSSFGLAKFGTGGK